MCRKNHCGDELTTSSPLLIVGSHYLTAGRLVGEAKGVRGEDTKHREYMRCPETEIHPTLSSFYNLIQIQQSVAHSYLNEHLTKSLLCFLLSLANAWQAAVLCCITAYRMLLGKLPRSLCFSQHTDI